MASSSCTSACPFNVKPVIDVLIVDDEPPARARLRGLLDDCQAELANAVVGEADNGEAALRQVEALRPDVVLLDIHMPGMNGLDCAQAMARLPQPPAVIFVTAHDEHAIAAFEVGAIDYLLKPVRLARLVEALQRARRLTPADEATLAALTDPERHFTVNDRGRVWRVPVEDVLYLRAELKYVTLRTREREYVLAEALNQLEQAYPDDFLRIHRNCLVARRHLTGFELGHGNDAGQWYAVLKNWPERLPVSRRQTQVIKAFRNG